MTLTYLYGMCRIKDIHDTKLIRKPSTIRKVILKNYKIGDTVIVLKVSPLQNVFLTVSLFSKFCQYLIDTV